MKRILAILLGAIILLFSGCASVSSEEQGSDIKCYGDTDNRKSLRICMDVQNFWTSDPGHLDRSVEEFISLLKEQTGLKRVIIEYLPSPEVDPSSAHNVVMGEGVVFRKTAMDRLRAEILSGGGPDVFIMTQMSANPNADLLFPFPQKTMENGLFLPLDEYMEKAEYAEWEKFPQVIMDAGRNEEGQQIIPLVYTLPVVTYRKLEFDYTPSRQLSWDDMLNDPVLAPYTSELANCSDAYVNSDTNETERYFNSYLEFVLGESVDYESEKLLFTEEELLQRVYEVLALNIDKSDERLNSTAEMTVGSGMNSKICPDPLTMIPMYSDDGGVTARIKSYVAINRNTQRPKEAFAVIDYLLDAKTQSYSTIYSDFLCNFEGIPMHHDIFQESMPLCRQHSLTNENYKELCEVREQITDAHFESEVGTILAELLMYCSVSEHFDKTVEEFVHEAYVNMQRRVSE